MSPAFFYVIHYSHYLAFAVLYIPSSYVIETFGVRKSVFGGMLLTTVGLFLSV